ncbi:NUDIX domain-containing protein [Bacillus cereus]|nr:NUDIX domain-containing protein [Bacillus cereus]
MEHKFHHIVRGILINERKILISELKGQHAFLPGGHIKFGEKVEVALKREFKEELDINIKIEKFLGVIENYWTDEDTVHYEINHLFHISSNNLKAYINPTSKEHHIKFYWIDVNKDNIIKYNVLPTAPLKILIDKLEKQDYSPCWISNL